MMRVTNMMMQNNLLNDVSTQAQRIQELYNQGSSGNRIDRPEQDPHTAASIMRLRTDLGRNEVYSGNIQNAQDQLNLIDGKLQNTVAILQSVRERAVQGANGVWSDADRSKIAMEVDQLLREMISNANTQFRGQALFGGHRVNELPYEVQMTREPGTDTPMISEVRYVGDLGQQLREIDRGEYLAANVPGIQAFWATPQRVSSQTDANGYVAARDQVFSLNGVKIAVSQGDSVDAIADKINQSGVAVHATIDNTTGNAFLSLESTKPGALLMRDEQGGRVLQDLGLIVQGRGLEPGSNLAPTAQVSGESMFDAMISLRDGLIGNDLEAVNRGLGLTDSAMANVLDTLSEVGAKASRLEFSAERISQRDYVTQETLSKIASADLAEVFTELKNAEASREAALRIGGRLFPVTLLDFVR